MTHTPDQRHGGRELPEDADRIVVARQGDDMGIKARPPTDEDRGGARFEYTYGDELPAELGERCYLSFPDRVVVLNSDDRALHYPDDLDGDDVDELIAYANLHSDDN